MSMMSHDLPPLYGEIPGAAPPLHIDNEDPTEDQERTFARFAGRDDHLHMGSGTPVGIRTWNGGGEGYQGRDLDDPSTWTRQHNEGVGVFARLHQEQPK